MKVSVLGCGNVGVAIAADLSKKGHEVSLVKTSSNKSDVLDTIRHDRKRVFLYEDGWYSESTIGEISFDLSSIRSSDVIFVTIQSTYHEELIRKIAPHVHSGQIIVVVCSYMSSFFFRKYCKDIPTIVETAGPYLEGRTDLKDVDGSVVFRVGCRLNRSPLSIFQPQDGNAVMGVIRQLYGGFSNDYSTMECALLNPNMVIHTVGSIMSIPRIEFSDGNFCMYREAYSHKNEATLKVMTALDEEKKSVLSSLGCNPVDIFVSGGFATDRFDKWGGFFRYSESEDRAISPTSVRSRYIIEDVSQGLVFLESVAGLSGVSVPVASSLITIASNALGVDFRSEGRTVERLGAGEYVNSFLG